MSNIYIIIWVFILILCIINLFKQIFIPEITKDATIMIIPLLIYILMTEVENKYLREVKKIQDETIDEAKEIIIELAERNKKLEGKSRKEKKYEL